MPTSHIGVFDSGVGGLSVLRALRAALPSARLSYFADTLHAPYGERDADHVVKRSMRIAQGLVGIGAGALVVACNTATALAVEALRAEWPALPIIGVEPGIKPAIALSRNGRVGVLATPATLRSARFHRLVQAHAAGCHLMCQPCPGLAARIEQGRLDEPDLAAMVNRSCEPLRDGGIDVVVLGCTHYPFVRDLIAHALGNAVEIVDTAEAVARQTALRCAGAATQGAADTALLTRSDVAAMARLAREWLPFECRIEAAGAAFS